MSEKTDRELAPWNGAASLVFIAALVGAYALLSWDGALNALYSFDLVDGVIVAFAAFRITHLFTYDKIFNFIRNAFMDWRDGVSAKPRPGFRRLMCELFECIWCTSIWSGLIALTLYLIGPLGRFSVIVLALAGAASLLQLISKLVSNKT